MIEPRKYFVVQILRREPAPFRQELIQQIADAVGTDVWRNVPTLPTDPENDGIFPGHLWIGFETLTELEVACSLIGAFVHANDIVTLAVEEVRLEPFERETWMRPQAAADRDRDDQECLDFLASTPRFKFLSAEVRQPSDEQ